MTRENSINRSEKLRHTPIGRLLFSMSLPAMLSMLAHSFYNIVDSAFVAQYNDKAFEALSIVFPMQMMIIAFSTGLGVGANAVVAKKLGERNKPEANLAAQTGLLFNLIAAALFVLVGVFATRPFVESFSNDPETVAYGVNYLSIILIASSFAFIEIMLSKILQATGNMKIPMIAQLTGTAINIILDPILIFGLAGFPELGIKGAAIATVLGQAGACLVSLSSFLFGKQEVNPFFGKGFRLKKDISASILRIGVPTIILKGLASVTVSFINGLLKDFENAIVVLGIYTKLQSFVFMPVFGLTQGALPILSYNYGANQKKRYIKTFRLSLIVSLSIMALGTIIFQSAPHLLLKIFKASGALLTMGVPAMRILSGSFLFAAFTIIIIVLLQSLGKG
ncbi:MAG: MATE family efflux transporter, partial [Clostridia bacterium]|nr:MATE family efflux transporter [Clostridia bacterium]